MEKDLAACIIIDCHVGSAAMETCPDSTRLSCFLYSLNLYGICLYRYMSLSIFLDLYLCTCFTYLISHIFHFSAAAAFKWPRAMKWLFVLSFSCDG